MSMTRKPETPLRSRLARGAVMMSAISVFMRMSSLLAQLVLGRLLLEEDFGLFAMALGFTAFAASLRSVLQPVLIDLLENDVGGFRRIYRTTMASVWLGALAGAALAGPISGALSEPDLRWLLVVMMLIMPFQVWPAFGMSSLNHDLQFSKVGRILGTATLVRYVALVSTAVIGFGPYSFAFGTGGAMLTECFFLRRHLASSSPGVVSVQTLIDIRSSFQRFFGSGAARRWVWLSAIALALTTSGDYLAASFSSSLTRVTIGLYFFAYTLTGAFHQPITLAVNTVLVPGFVGLPDLTAKRERLFDVLRVSTVLGVLLFNSIAVMVAPLMHLLWGGKWNAAISAALGFLLLAPLQALHPIALAIARGAGFWNLYFTAILANGGAVVVAAAVGAASGSLVGLVAAVVISYTLVTFSTLMRLARRVDASASAIAQLAVGPWILGIPGLVAANLISPLDDPDLTGSLLGAVAFAAITTVLVVVPYRATIKDFVGLILRKR